jgi:hypothetical protein
VDDAGGEELREQDGFRSFACMIRGAIEDIDGNTRTPETFQIGGYFFVIICPVADEVLDVGLLKGFMRGVDVDGQTGD